MATDKYWAKHIEQQKAHIEEKSTKSTVADLYAYAEKQAVLTKVRIAERSTNQWGNWNNDKVAILEAFDKAKEAIEEYGGWRY